MHIRGYLKSTFYLLTYLLECCKIVFLFGQFLFTYSDIFAVGYLATVYSVTVRHAVFAVL